VEIGATFEMKAIIAVSGLLLLLLGCAQPTIETGDQDTSLPSVSDQIKLDWELEIRPDNTRVFFQRGQVVAKRELDHYHPSCDLEVRTLNPEVQHVKKDLFTVTRVVFSQESIVLWDGVRMAGLGWGGGLWREGGHSIYRFIRMELHSDVQPDVLRLTCRGAYEDYHRASYPSPVEIRIALGGIITLP